jgi:hypothetical protein
MRSGLRRGMRRALGVCVVAAFVIAHTGCSNTAHQSATGPGGGGSCGSVVQGPTPPAGQADSLIIAGTVAPECQFSCAVGTGLPVTAIVKDAFGTILTNQTVTWVSSNPGVIAVSGKGLTAAGYIGQISCNGLGTVTVSAVDQQLEASVNVVSQ